MCLLNALTEQAGLAVMTHVPMQDKAASTQQQQQQQQRITEGTMSEPRAQLSIRLQARNDWFFIAMPNAMGVAFNTVALLLCAFLPARERQSPTDVHAREPSMMKRMLQSFQIKSSTEETVVPEAVSVPDLTVNLGSETQHAHVK